MNFAAVYPNGDIKGEIEIFASRKGHVTDWHFDYMENFTYFVVEECVRVDTDRFHS